jgi:UDP-N-acetylmuramoylalanine--D-glutamate ligase
MNQTAVCQTGEVRLLGRHNLQNVCAALLAVWDLIDRRRDIVKKVLGDFAGLPHHLELVRRVNDVSYYDDSFGTTPETAIVALQTFAEPKVIILGGSDKQASFDQLAQAVVDNNVRAVVTIGDTAPKIEAALRAVDYNHIARGGNDIKSIVSVAQSQAQPGDLVLLSTACASFGLFENYKDRGQKFQAAVKAL